MKAGTDKKKTVGATGKTNAPAVGEFIMNRKENKKATHKRVSAYRKPGKVGAKRHLKFLVHDINAQEEYFAAHICGDKAVAE